MAISKRTAGLFSMFLGLAMSNDSSWMYDKREQYNELTSEQKEELHKRIKAEKERERIERLKAKGVKEWIYYKKVDDDRIEVQIKIYARNKKNADRKARNKGCVIF